MSAKKLAKTQKAIENKTSKGIADPATPPANAPLVGRKYLLEDSHRPRLVTILAVKYCKEHHHSEKEWRVVYYNEDSEYKGSISLKEFLVKDPVLLDLSIEGSMEEWAEAEIRKIEHEAEPAEEETEAMASQALAQPNSKDTMIQLRNQAEVKRQRCELVNRIMQRRLERLRNRADGLREQVALIQKHIDVIELYLGVYEEIVLLRDGTPLPADTPLAFRQQILYMDEECGDPRPRGNHRGIDFQDVSDFDAWLLQEQHLDQMLPEPKGAVAIRPSRQERKYSDNHWTNVILGAENRKTYILIRNGERVWRIWTGTDLGERLFPGKAELSTLLKEAKNSYWKQEDAEEKEFNYKRNVMLLQGLIDRTEVFQPFPGDIKLMDPSVFKTGRVNLIYDDEPALTDGRLPWREWKKKINAQIGRGSRVILADNIRSYEEGLGGKPEYLQGRLKIYTRQWYALPAPGVYTVYEMDPKDTDAFWIRYNPRDTVFSTSRWEPLHERKRSISLRVYRSDDWVLNYDQIDLADVEYYIRNRTDRVNYLQMIPLLWELRERRLAEMEWEKHFVALVSTRVGCSEDEVREAVDWWKHKNIWKRPITKDDALALRMIERRLSRKGANP